MKGMRYLYRTVFVSAIFAMSGSPITGLAATANVTVGMGLNNAFFPATTNIAVNDRVIWTWGGNFHSTTSGTVSGGVTHPDGLWDSGVNNTPHSFTNSFPTPGSFPFYCSVHFGSGMTGAVNVAAPNLPPSVAITNPAPGAVFAAPANVTIQASASGNGGTVTNVEFLVDSTVLGDDTTAPYSAVTNGLAAGSHTLSAIAANSTGLTATNSVSISVVNPTPILLSAPASPSSASFQFNFTANAGLRYVVARSTDLTANNWIPLATNLAGSSSVTFTDINATVNPAYYRVGLLPNP
jgi:plastocyanin